MPIPLMIILGVIAGVIITYFLIRWIRFEKRMVDEQVAAHKELYYYVHYELGESGSQDRYL